MKVGIVLLAHKHSLTLPRLARRLMHPDVRIYLHVDRNTKAADAQAICESLPVSEKIRWLPRYYSYWGSWGLVQAALSGMIKAREDGCEYVILLSGQDYPIRPIDRLISFLANQNGGSFIQFYSLPSAEWPPDGVNRYTRWHFNIATPDFSARKLINRGLNRFFNTLFRTPALPTGLKPFGGSQWWCLHRDAVDYVVEFLNKTPEAVRFFRHVRIPDEMVFHTVLLNSPLRDKIINRTLTHVDWQGPPYPRILGVDDFQALATSQCFFARKVDDSSLALMDMLDAGEPGLL